LVVVLTANNATCGGLHANGGVGGMAGAGFGPGGGGGGGFVLLQAATKSCVAAESGGAFGTDGTTARQATAGIGGFTVTAPAGGFTGAPCILGSGNCGGCVLNTDCTVPYTCDVLTNMCTDFFPDGGLIPDGGLLLPDGGLGFLDAGTDAGLLTDGGSGRDGGSGTDGGSGSDGGFFDGGSFDGGNVTADAGNGNQSGAGDDDNSLEGGGCSSSGSSTDGTGAAVIGLGLVAALAFMRRKRR
jgi:MYXO-CTERM domain-containing protein